jgi:hypothetical protein
MVFWATNRASAAGRWNLEELDLTSKLARRLLG